MNRTTVLGLSIVLLVVGCQAQQMRNPSEVRCAGNECSVDVMVSGNPPQIDPVAAFRVGKGNQGAGGNGVILRWQLRNPDYEFKDDGIAFYKSAARQEFDQGRSEGGGAQFHWRDKNQAAGEWGYQVKIYNKRTGDWISLDPIIYNEGR